LIDCETQKNRKDRDFKSVASAISPHRRPAQLNRTLAQAKAYSLFRWRLSMFTAVTDLSDRALVILHEWVQSESLRKHCYAVADSMRHFAQISGGDLDLWQAVGLLHDMDYERHPNYEQSATEGHPFVAVRWLRENGWGEIVCRAILSHASYSGVTREAPLEKTLYAVDELSGFVMAVARVRPSKSIREVDVAAVKKKMKDKAFARAVNRDDIINGAAELGVELDQLIAEVIAAITPDADRLGIAGA
jgi:putative nucleotidyltransferase with HDIG domain